MQNENFKNERGAGFKPKTIERIIGNKVEKWKASIKDDATRTLVNSRTIVSGGCIASMLLGEQPHDFDLYFKDVETAQAVAQYYVNEFISTTKQERKIKVDNDGERVRIMVQSDGVASDTAETLNLTQRVLEDSDEIEDLHREQYRNESDARRLSTDNKYKPVFISTNAITLSGAIQLVLRFTGEPDIIHKNYDYVHCTNYWDSSSKLVLRPEAMAAVLSKELVYNGSKYPICSLIRLRKFIKRGWTINAGQILKMCMQIHELDLKNISVLQDQLMGVDVVYFEQLIHMLKSENPQSIDSSYLVELINKIF